MAGPTLSLSQQQRQVMTLAPQLRQSLEMLQMPVLELRAAILKEMSVNPTIEDLKDPSEVVLSVAQPEAPEHHVTDDGLDFNPDVDAILQQDDEWRDYFMQGMENAPSNEDAEEKRQYMFDSIKQKISLQDHLLEQLTLTNLSDDDRQLAMQPSRLSEFITLVRERFEEAARMGEAPVLVTSPGIRPFVRSIVERFRAQTPVLSQSEIHPRARLRTVGSI